jgi:hypothetical protein
MVKFAYVDCGLSVDEFYGLSFYEWQLEVNRVKRKAELKNAEWEGQAMLFRELMALTANINRNPKRTPTPFEGKDFIRLSFDPAKEEKGSRKLTQEEVDAKFEKVKRLMNGK